VHGWVGRPRRVRRAARGSCDGRGKPEPARSRDRRPS
jgi:hypothetical protein